MKVTIDQDGGGVVTLKIEGKLAGLKVPELHRVWQALASTLGSRRLSVDLRGVTFVDSIGKRELAEIHTETGAEFLADTQLTKYFADQAQQYMHTDSI
jgi:anti-anti-sigma regulatory factor